MRTLCNSGNELLLAFGKRLDSLQGFFPTDLLALGTFDFYFRLQGFHDNPPRALCRKRKQLGKTRTGTEEKARGSVL